MKEAPKLMTDSTAWLEYDRERFKKQSKVFLVLLMAISLPFWALKMLGYTFELCSDELDRRKRDTQ